MDEVTNNNSYSQEDEIDLKELFMTIKKYIWKIIFFVSIVTALTLAHVLSLPNSYQSSSILASQMQSTSSVGGLASLAGMAGIDLGGGGSVDVHGYLDTILKDYNFNKRVVEKYKLTELIDGDENNFIFAFGYKGVYKMLHSKKEEGNKGSKEKMMFGTIQKIQASMSFSQDKKSGIMTLSFHSADRFLAQKLVKIYLKESTSYLRTLDMKDAETKISYYKRELGKRDDIEFKKNLATILSSLVEKRVLSKSSEYYLVREIIEPQVSNPQAKTKPKRSLILVVSFVTSFILGIFLVFFVEFIKNNKEK